MKFALALLFVLASLPVAASDFAQPYHCVPGDVDYRCDENGCTATPHPCYRPCGEGAVEAAPASGGVSPLLGGTGYGVDEIGRSGGASAGSVLAGGGSPVSAGGGSSAAIGGSPARDGSSAAIGGSPAGGVAVPAPVAGVGLGYLVLAGAYYVAWRRRWKK